MQPIGRSATRRPLFTLLALLVLLAPTFGAAQASGSGVVSMRASLVDGPLVAAGDLDDGRLDVEVVPGMSGLATIEFVFADGTSMTAAGSLSADGQLTVFTDGVGGTLADFLAGYGTSVTVGVDDSIGAADERGDDDAGDLDDDYEQDDVGGRDDGDDGDGPDDRDDPDDGGEQEDAGDRDDGHEDDGHEDDGHEDEGHEDDGAGDRDEGDDGMHDDDSDDDALQDDV